MHTPDRYAGHRVGSIDDGFPLPDRIGRGTVWQRTLDAMGDVPAEAVPGRLSMGAGPS